MCALFLGLAANAALVPAFLLLAPASSWSPPVLLVAIAALAVVGCFNSFRVTTSNRGVFLDSEFVAALLAVVLLGPLPAMCVWVAGEMVYMLLLRQRREAHLANIASYGWAALAGALVLQALVPGGVTAAVDPEAWLAVTAAGIVVLCVNFAISDLIVAIVLDGRRPGMSIREELIAASPATMLMIATGTLTIFLYLAIGIPALALFSVTVFTPRLAANLGLGAEPEDLLLDHSRAFPLYAEEIASEMRLGSAERLVVRDAASFMCMDDFEAPRGNLSNFSDDHRHALVEALMYRGEHWDGRGGRPGAVGGEMIPLTSRILAVADAWATLTAGGTPRLTHDQALNRLQARAGVHFDPAVVAVAARLVDRGSLV